MQKVIPALRIFSIKTSSAFYEKLGFKEKWRHQFEPGFPIFTSIARDEMEIFLTEHTGDCQFGGLVHFYVPDVDECYLEFKKNGIIVENPPGNGLGPNIRDMIVVDPDGNRLSFITRFSEENNENK